ncbi:STAS domain-containing protein [candidate division KSB1 bacterium]|nr:STAS domain-containing protein [candidate division KSB1 bacterium]
MQVNIKSNQSGITIIELFGEIDLDSSPDVRKQILTITQKKSPKIIINLAGVTYMDSSGVATMVEGLQRTNAYNGLFVLVNLGPGVREVFELSRLDKVFKIYEDINEALKKLE